MDAKIETLKPAADLARDNPVRFPNESADCTCGARRCWPKRSSCGGISSGWPSNAAPCRRAGR